MKRLAVFAMLLMHMNYFMFLPQNVEADTYDASGKQTDDINSVIEYARVEWGYDKTADDEDDDSGKNLTPVKTCECFFQQQITILRPPAFVLINGHDFAVKQGRKPVSVSYDIISPPPEA
ncbi:MAG: hypothetical protein JNM14_14375 [Ferruginibacter sp.]|nr:hypothetical protein [Ferruginibacter sp.]